MTTSDRPFVKVEPDLALALELTARRKGSGAQFAGLLKRLIELCREQGAQAALAEQPLIRGEPLPVLFVAPELVPQTPPLNGSLSGMKPLKTIDEARRKYEETHPDKTPSWKENPPVPSNPAPPPEPKPPKEPDPVTALTRGFLSEEAKMDIRRRYGLIDKTQPEAEKKWIEHIAKEYKKSSQYIYRVIYSDPNYKLPGA